jgi:hypothetical protein
MKWHSIFKPSEILTEDDRRQLQAIEKNCEPYLAARARIEEEFCQAADRIGRLEALAEQYAADIASDEIYRKMIVAATMPSNPASGYQHREAAIRPIDGKIREIRQAAVPVVRRVLQRALDSAENELKKTEGRERKDAEAEGYEYSPSGRVLALQARVLRLRNSVAEKYRSEGAIQDPPNWTERLAEWL